MSIKSTLKLYVCHILTLFYVRLDDPQALLGFATYLYIQFKLSFTNLRWWCVIFHQNK